MFVLSPPTIFKLSWDILKSQFDLTCIDNIYFLNRNGKRDYGHQDKFDIR